ncbi:MAG: diguanylate cyclase, partial [Methylocystis sp.]|nr:diguanylate cyclase [Methylocystis sp.]
MTEPEPERQASSARRFQTADIHDPHALGRLEKEQFDALRRNTPAMLVASACNAFAALTAFIGSPQFEGVAIWCGAVVVWTIYAHFRRRWRRAHGAPSPAKVERRATINALTLGILWSLLSILFFSNATPGEQLVVASLNAGMMFGGLYALATAPVAAAAFATPIALAVCGVMIAQGDAERVLLALMFGVYTLALLSSFFINAAQTRTRLLAQIEAEKQALTDTLTGLPNRRAFNDAVEREFARSARTGAGFLLLCVDLDHFKEINDQLGHPAGDELLAQAAARMRSSLRTGDIVARLGGDEFAILATHIDRECDAREVARRIVTCYDRPFVLDGRDVHTGASVGGALAPRDGADLRELVKSADIALYRAKRHGGCWSLFEAESGAEAREARKLELELRRSIFTSQLALVYQPIVNVSTCELVGCEALLRWRHPERGEIRPAIFIPIAERIGLIHEIGMLVIDRACAAAASLPSGFRVAVNVSAVQLRRAD